MFQRLEALLTEYCSGLLLLGGAGLAGSSLALVFDQVLLARVFAVCGALALTAGGIGLTGFIRGLEEDKRQLQRNLAESVVKLGRDPLTGQLNRSAFNRTLSDLAETHSANTMVMLIFFDLNRFKEVNDTLGHDIGDLLLQEVALRAAEILEEDSLGFARLGGDEFAALLPYKDELDARRVGDRLVAGIGEPYDLAGKSVQVSASVGIAIGDPAVQGGDELLRRADLAMYEVKGVANGGYHIFDDLLSNRQMRENTIRAELGQSEFERRFLLNYQPIINSRTGKIEKVEALLRSHGGALNGISPALMVEVAEDSGQIVRLTDWTLDEALDTAKALQMPVAVNVSPIYFRHQDFADRVIDKLISKGASPDLLILEITEGVLIADITTTREAVDHLRAVGIKVWLDDFGTGYSSLSYLQNFELDGMKLDRSFIHELGRSEKAARIIRSIIDFGHTLGMQTVVEGVESEWQARMLQLQGCDYMQGFYLGLPMVRDEIARRMQEQRAQDDVKPEPGNLRKAS
ncbi:putative bifunctional diguanylate cyclase/phosphodiesterase [Altererythrobacter sp. CAU 1778]